MMPVWGARYSTMSVEQIGCRLQCLPKGASVKIEWKSGIRCIGCMSTLDLFSTSVIAGLRMQDNAATGQILHYPNT